VIKLTIKLGTLVITGSATATHYVPSINYTTKYILLYKCCCTQPVARWCSTSNYLKQQLQTTRKHSLDVSNT